jgi:hypothetical protein
VLQIHDILGWIRMADPDPDPDPCLCLLDLDLDSDPDADPAIFAIVLPKMPTKNYFFYIFFLYTS